jgi:hypothetical protein
LPLGQQSSSWTIASTRHRQDFMRARICGYDGDGHITVSSVTACG